MRIFVLNSGSSSIKYKLFSHNEKMELITEGIVENVSDYKGAIHEIIGSLDNLSVVAHRVVHGGSQFKKPTLINDEVIEKIRATIPLAPLHNPANLEGILAISKLAPNLPQIAFFDTAFHHTIPEVAYRYPLPKRYYTKMGIRRYGFHGISHQYLLKASAKLLNKPIGECNLITLHLGNGASVTAIKNGKSIDTSMGFTPLEGLIMGTRSGDIDAGILLQLQSEDLNQLLNYESGLKGIAGTNDMRKIVSNMQNGDRDSKLAFEMFCRRIVKYIGAYMALIGKVDAIVFSGGIGEHSREVRDEISNSISHLLTGVKIYTIPTNEELEMARETLKILGEFQNDT